MKISLYVVAAKRLAERHSYVPADRALCVSVTVPGVIPVRSLL